MFPPINNGENEKALVELNQALSSPIEFTQKKEAQNFLKKLIK